MLRDVSTALSSLADTVALIVPDTSDSALIDEPGLLSTRSMASARYCGVASNMYSAPATQNVQVIAINSRLWRTALRHKSISPSLFFGTAALNDECPDRKSVV